MSDAAAAVRPRCSNVSVVTPPACARSRYSVQASWPSCWRTVSPVGASHRSTSMGDGSVAPSAVITQSTLPERGSPVHVPIQGANRSELVIAAHTDAIGASNVRVRTTS